MPRRSGSGKLACHAIAIGLLVDLRRRSDIFRLVVIGADRFADEQIAGGVIEMVCLGLLPGHIHRFLPGFAGIVRFLDHLQKLGEVDAIVCLVLGFGFWGEAERGER